MISDGLQDNPVVIMYTQALCDYCAAARALFDKKSVVYEEVDVTLDADLRREMAERAGSHTVPQIFVDERPIGGYDELAALDRKGKLDRILGLAKTRRPRSIVKAFLTKFLAGRNKK